MKQSEEQHQINKAMLLGVRFTLQTLGVAKDSLLSRFVEQEFQSWIQRVERPLLGPTEKTGKSRFKPSKKGGRGRAR